MANMLEERELKRDIKKDYIDLETWKEGRYVDFAANYLQQRGIDIGLVIIFVKYRDIKCINFM